MTQPRPPLAIHRPQSKRAVAAAARKAHQRMRAILHHSDEGRWAVVWIAVAALAPFVVLLALGLLVL